jgi:transmembrane sensor
MAPGQIKRFFHKECTSAEAEEVAAYLKANPSVLEDYLSMYEWNEQGEQEMPEAFWNEVWNNIQQKRKAEIISIRLKRTSVAACLIFLAGAAYFYLNHEKKNNKPVAAVQINTLPESHRRTALNNTDKIISIVLEDSSVVKLSPSSLIQYDVPFPSDKREIFLEGEAEFHVAKNKHKPFTVYAGALATTALGTVFSVKRNADKHSFFVKLFEGKVVIRSTENKLSRWKQDVYLRPGQQLKYNSETAIVYIDKINTDKATIANKARKRAVVNPLNDQLNFSNTLLPEVMHKLSRYFNVKIQYDSLLLSKMYFSGIVSKNDSLPVILKAIAQMNGLEISINNKDEYMIY